MKAATARRLDLEERMRDTARRRVREAEERLRNDLFREKLLETFAERRRAADLTRVRIGRH